MKKKIIQLLIQARIDYWDNSEGNYDKISDSDEELNNKTDQDLAEAIIALFNK